MSLVLILAVLLAFAMAAEVLNFVARDFLANAHGETALKQSIQNAQKEIAESVKRIDALRTTLRTTLTELTRVADGVEKLDDELADRQRVEAMLIHEVRTNSKSERRYRAPIRKTLPAEAEDSQRLMWEKPALVEVVATSAEDARAAALRQFPSHHGYALGDFAEAGGTAGEAAA